MSAPEFKQMDDRSRTFYSRLFANVMLNVHAVRLGVYPTLLSESDDPTAGAKWREAIPSIIRALRGPRP